MAYPIQNGKDVLLSQNPGSLPNMGSTVLEYFQPLTFLQITKAVVQFKLVEQTLEIFTRGVKQPFTSKKLQIMPEGQRAWSWHTIHLDPKSLRGQDLNIKIDDILVFPDVVNGNTPHRVMQVLDYTQYGYIEIQVIEDYRP